MSIATGGQEVQLPGLLKVFESPRHGTSLVASGDAVCDDGLMWLESSHTALLRGFPAAWACNLAGKTKTLANRKPIHRYRVCNDVAIFMPSS
jgi:hypothetical protein